MSSRLLVLLFVAGCGGAAASAPETQTPPAQATSSPAPTVEPTATAAPEAPLTPNEIAALPMARPRRGEGSTEEQMRARWLARTEGRSRELIEQLIRAQTEIQAAGRNATFAPLAAWYRDVSAAFPADVDVQLTVADAFGMLCSMMRLASLPDETACTEMEQRATALAAAHPNNARPHRLLAQVAREADNLPLAMREYATCVRLDPANVSCRASYDLVRATHTRPTCARAAVANGLQVFAATTTAPSEGARPTFDLLEQHYFAEGAALFGKNDIVSATAVTPEGNILQLELEAAAFDRMKAWHDAHASSSDAAFQLRVGRRHVAAAPAMGLYAANHTFMLNGAEGFTLQSVCQRVTVATVPADAELPASAAAPITE